MMKLLFSLHIILSFRLTLSFLDLEELKTINYGIDILDKPVVAGQEVPSGAILLTSKYGQPYQCSFPDRSIDEKKVKEDEKVAMETGIPELLKPMESGPCLVHTKGWWSYEFCYGKEIKQYHMEDGKITGTVIYLGYYESEFDWENSTEKSRSVRNRLNRYHSQQYVNGSKCDLTSTSRRTEVRFQCEDGSGDYIARVDEPETCVYILTIHTTKICHHPYLKPPSPNKPVPITCNPLLSEAEYEMYLEETQVAHQSPVKDTEAEKDDDVSLESHPEDGQSLDEPRGPLPGKKQDAYDKVFMESLMKGLGGALQQNEDGDGVKVKTVKDINDLEKIMGEMFKEATKTKKEKTKKKKDEKEEEEEEEEENDGKTKLADGIEVNDLEDSDSVEEFEKGLEEMGTDKARLARYKDNIRSAMEAQFDNILEEAEGELGAEDLDGVDKEEAFTHLTATLNQLLSKLDEAEKNLARANEALDAAHSRQEKAKREGTEVQRQEGDDDEDEEEEEEEGGEDANEKGEREGNSQRGLVQDEDDEDGFFTITQWDGEKSSSKAANQQNAQVQDSNTKSTTTQTQTTTLDDSVRVRVTRVKHEESKEKTDGEENGEDASSAASPAGSDKKQSLDIPADKQAQLEETVKNQLQKSGLKTSGSKVHVKIITAGYYGEDDDTLHVLSDEDSQAFNKMIITILGGDDEEVKEMERQQSMESAYNFKWNKRKQRQETDP